MKEMKEIPRGHILTWKNPLLNLIEVFPHLRVVHYRDTLHILIGPEKVHLISVLGYDELFKVVI